MTGKGLYEVQDSAVFGSLGAFLWYILIVQFTHDYGLEPHYIYHNALLIVFTVSRDSV